MNALKFVAQHVKNEDNFNSVSCFYQTNSKKGINISITVCIGLNVKYNVLHRIFSLLMTGNT